MTAAQKTAFLRDYTVLCHEHGVQFVLLGFEAEIILDIYPYVVQHDPAQHSKGIEVIPDLVKELSYADV